ncbi:MAG: LysM peptidoglycan-binding domain-containing protein [Oligoflexus sp.]|nr:LysM peptidoglycan-binding domain-containing protein [Oligoflexus sp.]
MKRSLVKLLGISYLFAATHLMTISCSSSEEGAEGEEVVAEEGNEAADAEGNNANEEGANNEESNNLGNNNEGGNAAVNNEFGNGAEGGANATAGAEGTGDAGAAGGDQNISQIIEEMNQTNPAAAAAPEAGFDNLAQNAAPPAQGEAAAAPAAPAATGAPVAPGLPELGSKMAYIVQKGDALGKIAQRVYGDSNKWTEIADFTGIANPKLIYPGDVVYYQLTEKTTSFASAYEGVGRSEVEVGQGDTLATIAGKVLGNSTLWKLIWRQNDKIDNPDKLTAGTKVYYIDHAKLAEIKSEVSTKVATVKVLKAKDSIKKVVKADKASSKTKSKVESKSSKSIEVANDQIEDQFSHLNSQNLVARLI